MRPQPPRRPSPSKTTSTASTFPTERKSGEASLYIFTLTPYRQHQHSSTTFTHIPRPRGDKRLQRCAPHSLPHRFCPSYRPSCSLRHSHPLSLHSTPACHTVSYSSAVNAAVRHADGTVKCAVKSASHATPTVPTKLNVAAPLLVLLRLQLPANGITSRRLTSRPTFKRSPAPSAPTSPAAAAGRNPHRRLAITPSTKRHAVPHVARALSIVILKGFASLRQMAAAQPTTPATTVQCTRPPTLPVCLCAQPPAP